MLFSAAYGLENDIKTHTIRCDMVHLYNEDPPEVNSIKDMFTQGIFYGRMRFNSFGIVWRDEMQSATNRTRANHATAGIGGSAIYRSAYLHGFGFTAGLYTSQGKGTLKQSEAYLYRSGRDVFNRRDVLMKGKHNLTSLAQAYLEYKSPMVSIKAGRQIFESFLTASNDTKMIPNTFKGLTLNGNLTPKTKLNMGYLTKQKLRDRSRFHHVLAVGDDENVRYSFFTQNDDAGMHRGLTLSKLEARGIQDKLIVLEAQNTSIEYLSLRINYTAVPKLISSMMFQADYRLYMGGWSIIPGFRYMQQFDNGAGDIGGANLRNLTQGYTDPDSLSARLYATRIDLVQDAFKFRFAYSKIADKGDIIAPWRGFPTGGYTRAMAQNNWNANTQSYMMQLDYQFKSISEFKIMSRFAIQDFDDKKIGVQADSNVFTLDLLKGLGGSAYYLKSRFAYVRGDADTVAANGVTKADPSYTELRLEVNYLF